ncbi:MAG: hypothetical protein II333_01545, partial [Clostridia bacterium]|nr:hypothetical protein [Clostridia bacterium]
IIKQKHMRLIILGSITVDCRNGQIDPMSQPDFRLHYYIGLGSLYVVNWDSLYGYAQTHQKIPPNLRFAQSSDL